MGLVLGLRLAIYHGAHVINFAAVESCCDGVVFKKCHDQMISKCSYNLFVAVVQIHRISLAGFSILFVLFTRLLA